MLFEKKTLTCKESGISQDEARLSLFKNANLAVGTEIGQVYEKEGRWAADVFIPKLASPPFPPDNDNEESDSLPKPKDESGESPSSDDDSSDSSGSDSSEKPPKPKSEGGGDKPKTDGGGEGEVVALLHQILDALLGPMSPAGPGAGMPAPHPAPPKPPMGGPPGGTPPMVPPGAGAPPGAPGGQQVIKHLKTMRPGEAPPGVLPVGAPALASKQVVTSLAQLNSLTGITNGKGVSLSQARADLEKKFGQYGFKVAQMKRLDDGTDKIAALLSR